MHTQVQLDSLNKLFSTEITEAIKGTRTRWYCPVSQIEIGGLLIIPLVSSKMLKSEAHAMRNCINSYLQECAEERYCLFSVRDLYNRNRRIATLGAYKDEGYWVFDQCVGEENIDVTEEEIESIDQNGKTHYQEYKNDIFYVSHEVVRLMNLNSIDQNKQFLLGK